MSCGCCMIRQGVDPEVGANAPTLSSRTQPRAQLRVYLPGVLAPQGRAQLSPTEYATAGCENLSQGYVGDSLRHGILVGEWSLGPLGVPYTSSLPLFSWASSHCSPGLTPEHVFEWRGQGVGCLRMRKKMEDEGAVRACSGSRGN